MTLLGRTGCLQRASTLNSEVCVLVSMPRGVVTPRFFYLILGYVNNYSYLRLEDNFIRPKVLLQLQTALKTGTKIMSQICNIFGTLSYNIIG